MSDSSVVTMVLAKRSVCFLEWNAERMRWWFNLFVHINPYANVCFLFIAIYYEPPINPLIKSFGTEFHLKL